MLNRKDIRAACIQLNSGRDIDANLSNVSNYLKSAAEDKCELVLLPENFSFMGNNEREKLSFSQEEGHSEVLAFLASKAREHNMMIIGGSIPLKNDKDNKVDNACPVFSPSGNLLVSYKKIHLFDVNLPDENYRESDTVQAGKKPETVNFHDWKIGLSICYDLRFPELYRYYADKGCHILAIPAAFTVPTGRAHWEVLLRARAIENQAYVLAAGQCGIHPDGRKTWGHSMIVDPWGEIVASLDHDEGIISAELSLNNLDKIRQTLPALNHRRI